MRVVVVGGGKVGFYLVRTLIEHGHHVSIIERDVQRCQVLAEEFPILVINGDGTDTDALVDAGAESAEILAAVTGKDEENLLVCQIAKRRFRIKRAIARVNNPKNADVFRQLGIEWSVSGTGIIAELIEREMTLGKMRTLLTFHHGDMTILEVDLPATAPSVWKRVIDLAGDLPPESVLVAVIRRERVIFPRGQTVLEPGDTVMALVHTDAAATLNRVLLGEAPADA